MDANRRHLFKAVASLMAACWFQPLRAFADSWQKNAFEAADTNAVLSSLGVSSPGPGNKIWLDVPEIADNGNRVDIRVTSTLPGTDWIAILIDRNASPLLAQFNIPPGAEAYVAVPAIIPMTSNIRAVVRAAGKYYAVNKEVKIAVDPSK